MLGIHVSLHPVLVNEYSEEFELLVAEIKTGNTNIRIITGYGPQENWEEKERMPFFEALEKEIARAEFEGRSLIISMDANSKLGQSIIPGDPHEQSKNGKILSEIIKRHALIVVNGIQGKCTGLITRERRTVQGVEKSVIDFVIVSRDLEKHIEYMHIDDQRKNVLTKLIKTRKRHTKKVESEHNLI